MTRRAKCASLIVKCASLMVFSALALFSSRLAAHPNTAKQNLPLAARAGISSVLGRDQRAYQALARPSGLHIENPNHGLSVEFAPRGVALRRGADDWAMAFAGYGYGNQLQTPGAIPPKARENRVEYRRGGVIEWYVNGPLGLEQGFTLSRAPGKLHGEPLTFAITLSGSLTPSVDPGRRSLSLRKEGNVVLRYVGLTATDARGRELQTWLDVSGNRLQLHVDDTNAQYPVTLDPLIQAAELTASDGAANDLFGRSVRVSQDGTTVVAGAQGATIGTNAVQGAAYVFVKPANGWANTSNYTAKLTASDGAAGDSLGFRVAISGDGSVIAVSATPAAVNGNAGQGAAYLYVRPAGGWATGTETAKLTASDGVAGDSFGLPSISGDGNTIAVSANRAAFNGNAGEGAEYVFVKPATGWATTSTFAAKLAPSDGVASENFGGSHGLSDDGSTLVAGAQLAVINNKPQQGAVYVFTTANNWSTWAQVAKLTASDGVAGYALGESVSVSGDGKTVVAGAPQVSSGPGAAYVFVEPGTGWADTPTFTAKLTASDGVAGDALGATLLVSEDASTVVAGAPFANVSGSVHQGAAYVFTVPISPVQVVLNGTAADSFSINGQSISLSPYGGTMNGQLAQFICLNFNEPIPSGASWTANVTPLHNAAGNYSNTLLGSEMPYLVLAELSTQMLQALAAQQSAPFVDDQFALWSLTASLTATSSPDPYGTNASLVQQATNIVNQGGFFRGGWEILTPAPGQVGQEFLVRTPERTWSTATQTAKLSASDGAGGSLFGNGIGVSNDGSTAVVGAEGQAVNGKTAQGAAYVFTTAPTAVPGVLLTTSTAFIPLQAPNPIPNGTTMPVGSVLLSNTGNAPLNVTAVSLTPNPSNYPSDTFNITQQNCTGAPIPAPGGCTVFITFTAGSGSPLLTNFSATLVFTDNSGGVAGSTQTMVVEAASELVESSTTLSSVAPNPAVVGQPVTVSVSVVSKLLGDLLIPSGNVTVNASTGESCVATAPSGSCQITFAMAGTRTLTAQYGGDTNFIPSTSTSVSEQVVDFTLSVPSALSVSLGGSASGSVSIGSLDGFNSPVSLTTSTPPTGISAAFSPNPVTPPSGGSAPSTLTVSVQPSVTPTSFTLNVMASSGSLTHTAAVNVSVTVNFSSVSAVIGSFAGAGCIDNAGIANALTSKLSAAQAAVNSGDLQTAINVLGALEKQIQAQAGKHIATSCSIGGVTFNPVTVLLTDAQSLIDSLRTRDIADPIVGFVLSSATGQGVSGATLSILDANGNSVATAATDITGFYYVPTTGVFALGANYTIQVTGLAGFTSSTPAVGTFTWQGSGQTFNFSLN